MIAPPKQEKPPKIDSVSTHAWNNGYTSNTDITRSHKDALATADNVQVVQDGAVGPRPSTVLWGTQPVGIILGIDEFVKLDNDKKPETWLISVQTVPDAKATGTITSVGNANPSDDDKITIGGQTYVFKTALTTPDVAFEVLIGTDGEETLNNLQAALNLSGTDGTEYGAGTTANTQATAPSAAVVSTDATLGIEAINPGDTGNNIILTEDADNITVSGTLTGGTDVGKVYVNKDGGAWTECTGKTYNTTAKARFTQGAGKVLIMNGEDNLSYLDTVTMDIKVFSPLATPVISSVTPTGLTGSTMTYRYRVTALNEVGESIASVADTAVVGTDRDAWDPSTQYVTVSWGAVAGATGYGVYLGLSAGKEVLITTVPDTSTSYKDTGTAPMVVSRLAPAGNSTEGPITASGANVGGQIFMIGDKEEPYRVWYGGTGKDALDFSPFNGGGWIDVALGSKDLPVRAISFRDGKGTPMATILQKGTNGTGKITHLAMESESLADVIITYMAAYEANGQDGTDSPDGVVVYRDSMWYPSADGFKTTGTKPNIQNILSTNNISDTISTDIEKLNRLSMANCSGLAYDGRIYWSIPIGTSNNNQIWTLDLARGGQWMLPWHIRADQILLYGDNAGKTHFLVISDNKILEFTRTRYTEDNLTTFRTKVASGQIKVDENAKDWMNVLDVTFVLINPLGQITLSVQGVTEDGPFSTSRNYTFSRVSNYAGWGEIRTDEGVPVPYQGWGDRAWGEVLGIPVITAVSRIAKTVEVDEVMNYLQWILDSRDRADYVLSDVIIRYINVGTIITDEMEA